MIDREIVKYVAKLARIDIPEDEIEFLGNQLSKILDYIDKLKELSVENIIPMRGPHFEKNIFREDKVVEFQFKEEILKNAPLKEGNFFKIPKVIE